jgi:hypothetical protein
MILNQVNMPQLLNLQVVLRDRLHPWMWTGTSVEKADQPAESTQGTIQIPG